MLISLPVILFVAVYSLYAPDKPLLNPDSESYLQFSSYRTGGYPLFLEFLKPIIRDTADYALAQRLLYAIAVFALSWQIQRCFGRLLLTVFVQFTLLAIPAVNAYHFEIFTESLFLSTSAFLLAAALSDLRSNSWRKMAAASALCGYLITIRPSGVAFVPAIVGLLIATRPGLPARARWARRIAAVAPLLLVLVLENAYYHARHTGPRESLLPIQMFGKAGMIEVSDPAALVNAGPQAAQAVQKDLEGELAPVRRLIRGAPGLASQCRLLINYETFVEYEFARDDRDALARAMGPSALSAVSWARLRRGLPDYLRLTFDHWRCMWMLAVPDAGQLRVLDAYLAKHQPVPFVQGLPTLPPETLVPSWRALLLRRAIVVGSGVLLMVSACGFVFGSLRRRPLSIALSLAGLCGMAVHAGILVSALGSVGIPRYMIGLWVPLSVGACASLQWLMACFLAYPPWSRGGLRPPNTGWRFSMKARTPSA